MLILFFADFLEFSYYFFVLVCDSRRGVSRKIFFECSKKSKRGRTVCFVTLLLLQREIKPFFFFLFFVRLYFLFFFCGAVQLTYKFNFLFLFLSLLFVLFCLSKVTLER